MLNNTKLCFTCKCFTLYAKGEVLESQINKSRKKFQTNVARVFKLKNKRLNTPFSP
jgi:hypothetical protein